MTFTEFWPYIDSCTSQEELDLVMGDVDVIEDELERQDAINTAAMRRQFLPEETEE